MQYHPLHFQFKWISRASVLSGGEDGIIRGCVCCPSSFSYFLFLETTSGPKDSVSALSEKMPVTQVQVSEGFGDRGISQLGLPSDTNDQAAKGHDGQPNREKSSPYNPNLGFCTGSLDKSYNPPLVL